MFNDEKEPDEFDDLLGKINRMNVSNKKKRLEQEDLEKLINSAKESLRTIQDKIGYYTRRITTEATKLAEFVNKSDELREYIEKFSYEHKVLEKKKESTESVIEKE